VRLLGAGPYHLLRCFHCLTHLVLVPFLTVMCPSNDLWLPFDACEWVHQKATSGDWAGQ
jgi:hypothetical protein